MPNSCNELAPVSFQDSGLDPNVPFPETDPMSAAILTINLDAITANWKALDACSGQDVETAAVVKADGYGVGATYVAQHLTRAGVRTFFTAVAEEAVAVRKQIGPVPEIFVFSGHMDGDAAILSEHQLTPLLNSFEQLARHRASLPGHPFGVQLDTGMNRLGMEPEDWAAERDEILADGPVLLMSHLACADEPDHPMNAEQLRRFREMTDGTGVRRSLAATGGTLLGPDYHFDLTRPGVGLYGGFPFEEAQPVVQVDIPVIQARLVRKGETVGYSNTWEAKGDTMVATIAAGYADGLIRAMGEKAQVFANGEACKVIGRVSMDLITVDVTQLDHVPDSLQILGPTQSVDQLADAADTIGYELLTSLGNRYKRVYKGSA